MKIFRSLDDAELVELLQHGAVGVLPTDTVYGIVCLAANEQAVARLYALKSREHKPGTVIAANIDQLVALGIKRRYLKAVEHYWPAALSVIIPTSDLSYLRQDVAGVAVRVPADDALHNLLVKTGPLLTSSANQPGEPTSNNLADAQAYFSDSVDFYVDGGDLSDNQSSTLIRIVDDAVEVLRQGAVKLDEQA